MKKSLNKIALFSAVMLLSSCGGGNNETKPNICNPIQDDNKVHLVLLAGQSGARGKALNEDLSQKDKLENKNVQILADGLRMENLNRIPTTIAKGTRFKNIAPGFGDSSFEFGPEIGIGKALAARYPKDDEGNYKSALVKYSACGSTFYSDWMSESSLKDTSIKLDRTKVVTGTNGQEVGPLTNLFYQMYDKAKESIEQNGFDVVVDGVIFVHGEQDAKYDENMSIYEKVLENFIKDTRNYIGDQELPFVITEAQTNSAKYSNKLREIQKRVSDADKNCIYVSTDDLYTNTFEPWHFGAQSNIDLGERAASEIIALKDTRTIEKFTNDKVTIFDNNIASLPEYLRVNFADGSESVVPVEYENLTNDKVTAKVSYNCYEFKGDLLLDKAEYPAIDGKVTLDQNALSVGNKTKLTVKKTSDGLYVGAKVFQDEIYTDGELWSQGDMGQMGKNDDLEIFIEGTSATSGAATERYSVMLSSANLLRVYDKGTNVRGDVTSLPAKNMLFQKKIAEFPHRVKTVGNVNDNTKTEMEMEMFIPFASLNITGESVKLVAAYNDVSLEGKTKTSTVNYLSKNANNDVNQEEKLENYIPLSEIK